MSATLLKTLQGDKKPLGSLSKDAIILL